MQNKMILSRTGNADGAGVVAGSSVASLPAGEPSVTEKTFSPASGLDPVVSKSPAASSAGGEPPSPRLTFAIRSQPDDETCGPTCLHAVYHYFGDDVPFGLVAKQVPRLRSGGTLACLLACHALRRGYKARIYTYDMRTFDPTWLVGDPALVPEKLRLQMEAKVDPKLRRVCQAYREYFALGGRLMFEDLSRALIRRPLNKGLPIIVGLSSTYLYREMRDIPDTNQSDDVRGLPGGHFVVLHGYNHAHGTVLIADPYGDNPLTSSNEYEIPIDRVICAILLGIVTYDANLLILEPPAKRKTRENYSCCAQRDPVETGNAGRGSSDPEAVRH